MQIILSCIIIVFFSFEPAFARDVESLLEKRQKNVMIQKWDISCGAAALGTLLNYKHEDYVSEREIAIHLMKRDEYVRNPELVKLRLGFSLLDLQKYVESRGYIGMGLGNLEITDLIERSPIMVAIYVHGYTHFVVFRGMRRNRILLADPAWGNRTMTLAQFMDIWVEHPKNGHIGFQVINPTEPIGHPHALEAHDDDFVNLN
jgi:uncharacterized protein